MYDICFCGVLNEVLILCEGEKHIFSLYFYVNTLMLPVLYSWLIHRLVSHRKKMASDIQVIVHEWWKDGSNVCQTLEHHFNTDEKFQVTCSRHVNVIFKNHQIIWLQKTLYFWHVNSLFIWFLLLHQLDTEMRLAAQKGSIYKFSDSNRTIWAWGCGKTRMVAVKRGEPTGNNQDRKKKRHK